MARRGGWIPGGRWLAVAAVFGVAAGTGTLGGLVALATPGKPHTHHGAPNTAQSRVPGSQLDAGPYTPNVCHPNTEAPVSRAQLDAWITRAGQLLHRPYSTNERRIVLIVIGGESEGRAHAINCWDRNWSEGHPTMGLMQDRDDTFLANAPEGCRVLVLIYDGPCNIAASTRYALGRYGVLANIPGVGEVEAGSDYHSGY